LSAFEAASLSWGVTASAAEASLALSMRKVQCWSPFPTFSAFPLWGALAHSLMPEPHHHNWL
jgi:hypothetical protein